LSKGAGVMSFKNPDKLKKAKNVKKIYPTQDKKTPAKKPKKP
jgi:hypothetical protein